jgi:protein O-GlcNAc transferase
VSRGPYGFGPGPGADPFGEAVRLHQAGRLAEALRAYDRAIAIQPRNSAIHGNRGVALLALARPGEALESFDRARALKPDDVAIHNNRGNALRALNRTDDALAAYDDALRLAPNIALLHVNRANVLLDLGRLDDADSGYARALSIDPKSASALNGRAIVLEKKKLPARALELFDRVLAIEPRNVETHYNRANALRDLGRAREAIAAYDAALNLAPGLFEALHNKGTLLSKMGRMEEAFAALSSALATTSRHQTTNAEGKALSSRAALLYAMGRVQEAITDAERAVELQYPGAIGHLAHCRMSECDWREFDQLSRGLHREAASGAPIIPYQLLPIVDDPALQLEAAVAAHRDQVRPDIVSPPLRSRPGERIKLGYFSGEFRTHPVMQLLAETLERHDRGRFEVLAFALHVKRDDPYFQRLEKTCEEVIDVSGLAPAAAAALALEKGVDIAIDLNGFTGDSRIGIFRERAAPIQVNYLGYAGTFGAPLMDYIVADRIVIDDANRAGFSEQVVRLPDSFLPSGSLGAFEQRPTTRAEQGLPDDAFVLASINNHFKITPEVYDVWMRILARLPSSVLWLRCKEGAARENLRREAAVRGIDPSRILFMGWVPDDQHLSRFALADLFLDTRPYNAHTSASEALRMGLPVLTCPGATFASRVAASLLNAVGLPELVVGSMRDYEEKAVELASSPAKLAVVRERLSAQLGTCPLFDVERYTRHLEQAFQMMVERHRGGLAPADFDVPPMPR